MHMSGVHGVSCVHQTVSGVVDRLSKAFEDVKNFLSEFEKQGFLSKMYHGHIDAKKFAELDQTIVQLSSKLGTALDVQVRNYYDRPPSAFITWRLLNLEPATTPTDSRPCLIV